MRKRIIDIFPPSSRRAVSQEREAVTEFEGATVTNPEQKGSRTAKAVFASVLIFVVPLFLVHVFFARATIQVWPQITKLHVEEFLIAQVGFDKVNLEKKIVRARIFEEEVQQTLLFSSTGTKLKETKARGIIRIYNKNSTEPQDLVIDTRFISEDGKLFRLTSAVSIPGGQMDGRKLIPGILDVQVVAAQPGSEYNIEASKFSLPGLVGSAAYTKIFGESLSAMTGGAYRKVAIVTEEDIVKAADQLVEALKIQAVKSLLAKIPPEFQVLQDSLTSTNVEDNSLVKSGVELDQFNYTGKVTVSMVGFDKADADLIVQHFLSDYISADQGINQETLRVTYKASREDRGKGVIRIVVQVEADRYEKVDRATLMYLMQDVTDSQFPQLMREYPFLAKAQFSLWPFWISRIPKDEGRISLEILLEG